ncbi:hypothetical protein BKA62DRAFT_620060 [Auriculariales sp. MPI-PUGE-AT-0066]|nr:hypothetical protein BKA62DRAFT_620060 [Auriculariales sp. MPI-PUGE-AT-0066]
MATVDSSVHGLQTDTMTGEVYLRLAAPHDYIVITPIRHDAADVATLVRNLNDVRVARTLRPLPYPYTEADAHWWLGRMVSVRDAALQKIKNAQDGDWLDVVPMMIIRDTSTTDGRVSDAPQIGNCDLHKNVYFEVEDDDERQRLVEENMARKAGDAGLQWSFGMWLDPAYIGRGVMSAAMNALITQWAIPKMNLQYIAGTPFIGNIGSRRVMEKNGFKWVRDTADGIIEMGLNGGRTGLHVLEWRRNA